MSPKQSATESHRFVSHVVQEDSVEILVEVTSAMIYDQDPGTAINSGSINRYAVHISPANTLKQYPSIYF